MIRTLVVLVSVIAVHSAPTLLQQQYLFISPEAQLQLQPALKLQQPIVLPISQLRAPSLAAKSDVLVYYPSAPLVQYPFVNLRQNWIDQLTQIFTEWTQGGGTNGDDAEDTGDSDDTEKKKIASNKNAISLSPLPSVNPYIVVSQQPQFYGNYAGLQQVLVKGRSVQVQPDGVVPIQSESPVEPEPQPALRDTEPLEQFESSEAEALASSAKSVEPEVVSARFQSAYPAVLNQNEPDSVSLEGKAEIKSDEEKPVPEGKELLEESLKEYDDPSVARTGPVGIALAGKSGLASSHPFGTALVGKGGIALSSPQGTSIAGDFLNQEENH